MARTTPEKRNIRIDIKVSESERAAIEKKAGAIGLPVSTYMRMIVLGEEPPARRAGVDAEAVAGLNRVGSNLNQLARIGNKSGTLTPAQVKALGALHTQIAQTAARIGEALA